MCLCSFTSWLSTCPLPAVAKLVFCHMLIICVIIVLKCSAFEDYDDACHAIANLIFSFYYDVFFKYYFFLFCVFFSLDLFAMSNKSDHIYFTQIKQIFFNKNIILVVKCLKLQSSALNQTLIFKLQVNHISLSKSLIYVK